MSEILWQPSAERIAHTRMDRFRRLCNQRLGLDLDDYPALHRWSIEHREDFWQAIVDFFDVRFVEPPAVVLREGHSATEREIRDFAASRMADFKVPRRVIVVDVDRPTSNHGIDPLLLSCEFERVGFKLDAFKDAPELAGYYAQFEAAANRPEPGAIKPCVGNHNGSGSGAK